MALIDKLKALADAFRASRGLTEALTLDQMTVLAAESGSGGSSADVCYVTFMNGDTVLYRKPVAVGDDCVDVLTKGLIETPTKESTMAYTYTYAGWSKINGGSANASALSAVTEDRTVYAAFTATKIFYTVNFYDDENLELSVQAGYGETVQPPALSKAGYKLIGWNPEVITVTGNADYYALWESAVARLADYSWTELSAISQAGSAADMFLLGDTKTVEIDGVTLTAELVDFNIEEATDPTKVAGMFFEIQEVYPVDVQYHNKTAALSFNEYDIYTNTLLSVRDSMPEELKNVLVTVNKSRGRPDEQVSAVDIFVYNQKNIGAGVDGDSTVIEKYKTTNAQQERIKLSAVTKEPAEYWLSDVLTQSGSVIGAYYVKTNGAEGARMMKNAKGVVIGFCI